MEWIKQRYDQFILLVLALVLLASSVVLILHARSFKEVFASIRGEVVKNNQVEPVATEDLQKAHQRLKEPPQWNLRPEEGSLFISRKYLVKDAKLFDPRDAKEPLYPPVPNEWILQNDLDILDPDVLKGDPDGDGFSNLDEWVGKTDPNNKETHPPYYTKLRLTKFIKKPFRLLFAAYDGNPLDPSTITFQMNTLDVNQPTQFLKLGDRIEGTKFKIDKFEHKTFNNPNGLTQDISELTVKNIDTGDTVVLVLEKIVDSPDSYALFKYLWDGSEFQVKKEKTFKLPPTGTEYKVIDITESNAVIEDTTTHEKITVPKLEQP